MHVPVCCYRPPAYRGKSLMVSSCFLSQSFDFLVTYDRYYFVYRRSRSVGARAVVRITPSRRKIVCEDLRKEAP